VERKAHKRYHCIWCWQIIGKGEKYIDTRSIADGELQINRFHPECHAAMEDEAAEEGGEIEWIPGQERPAKEQA